MKKKLLSLIVVIFAVALPVLSVSAAESPYPTYTYSYSGDYQASPNAYLPEQTVTAFGESGGLNVPHDITTDTDGNVYIADTGNNRILVLNPDYSLKKQLASYQHNGAELVFSSPKGLFVSPRGDLFVCDTGNANIVQFDKNLNFIKVIAAPSSELLPENFQYAPTAVAVDPLDRFYVISDGTNMGVITFDSEGVFEGFIGAQKVQASAIELFWRKFMTKEQLARSKAVVPVSYNNLAIDKKGFIYVTSASIEPYTLQQLILSRSTSSPYCPIKKLNPSGTDVLNRNGFFPPVGDLNFDAYIGKDTVSPSALTEIAVRDNDIYSVADSNHNKIFTYDEYGNLLYIFGGTGTVEGTFTTLRAIAYQGDKLLAIDSVKNNLTVFYKTEYGMMIDKAINLQRDRKFSETITVWKQIEKQNNNYDLAYMGIGKALHEEGKYKEAMEYFKAINNKKYYSKSLKKYRTDILKHTAVFIPIILILAIWGIGKFSKFAKGYNLRRRNAGKYTLRDEIMYAFHCMLHPFDGFWDLKHEKRGGLRGATLLLLLATFTMVAKEFVSGYLYTDSDSLKSASILNAVGNILIPFFLWCISNWCLTTLMDGKGRLKDIYVSTAYALTPIILLIIPATFISNLLVLEELAFVSYAINIAFFWTGLLIFFGSLVTHDYSLGKNIAACVLTIIGIAIIMFLAFLFFNVTSRMITFLSNIYTEATFRF